MQARTLYITHTDRKRLERLMLFSDIFKESDKKNIRKLNFEMSQGRVVPDGQLPRDVVTIHSRVVFQDLRSGRDNAVRLVFPEDENERGRRISILAPLGVALLGRKVGDLVEITTESSVEKLRIHKVEH
jgi:regulator of nucleoside diphosphate kinase